MAKVAGLGVGHVVAALLQLLGDGVAGVSGGRAGEDRRDQCAGETHLVGSGASSDAKEWISSGLRN